MSSFSIFRPFIRSGLLRLRIAQSHAGADLTTTSRETSNLPSAQLSVSLFIGKLCKQKFRIDHLHLRYYSATERKMPESKKFERLPKDVIPSNYKLRLQPDLATLTFAGSEEITVEVSSEKCLIRLN